MYKIFLFSVFFFQSFSLLAQPPADDLIPVGTVSYSIIAPGDFLPLYTKWMLADGCDTAMSREIYGRTGASLEKFSASRLHLTFHIDLLPDARGMFIRGMNSKRNDGKQDTFTDDYKVDRKAGEFEADTVGAHRHKLYSYDFAHNDFIGDTYPGNLRTNQNPAPNLRVETFSYGGNETRPRNISLYIYIKVN